MCMYISTYMIYTYILKDNKKLIYELIYIIKKVPLCKKEKLLIFICYIWIFLYTLSYFYYIFFHISLITPHIVC